MPMPKSMRSLMLVLDVDGVCRKGVTDVCEPAVATALHALVDRYAGRSRGSSPRNTSLQQQQVTAIDTEENGSVTAVDSVVDGGMDGGIDEDDLVGKLAAKNLHISFLSGTGACATYPALPSEEWRAPNRPLSHAFADSLFLKGIRSGVMSIWGQLGAERATVVEKESGELELSSVMECGFGPKAASALCMVLLDAYCATLEGSAMADHAAPIRKMLSTLSAAPLLTTLAALNSSQDRSAESVPASLMAEHEPEDGPVVRAAPDEFTAIVAHIRSALDPHFRVIVQGATAEFQEYMTPDGAPPVKTIMDRVSAGVRALKLPGHIAGGIAHRDGVEFRWFSVTFMTKGDAVRHFEDLHKDLLVDKSAPLVTIGDSLLDFPMHVEADAAFHVGPRIAMPNAAAIYGFDSMKHTQLVLGEHGEEPRFCTGCAEVIEAMVEVGPEGSLENIAERLNTELHSEEA